jgi:hypothetical protein
VLKGKCNQCGNCCTIGPFKCENLVVVGEPGQPLATWCAVYDQRYPDMPIKLRDGCGEIQGFCMHDTLAEEYELTRLIIDKKCSLEIA